MAKQTWKNLFLFFNRAISEKMVPGRSMVNVSEKTYFQQSHKKRDKIPGNNSKLLKSCQEKLDNGKGNVLVLARLISYWLCVYQRNSSCQIFWYHFRLCLAKVYLELCQTSNMDFFLKSFKFSKFLT